MALPKDFGEQLPLKTDAELYDMLAHREDYLPEAVAAAEDELNRRNLAPAQIAQLEAKHQSENAAAEIKAQLPLGWPLRIFIFFFLCGIFGAILAVYYEKEGYKRKAADCWKTLGISAAVHIAAGLILWRR